MTKIDEQSIAVEVPKDTTNTRLVGNRWICYDYDGLPLVDTMLDFDCEPYVEEYITGCDDDYKDYLDDMNCFNEVEDSFRSLLASKGLDPYNKTYAILKKI